VSPAAEILVVILSIFLAFFLALGITLAIYLIKLTRDIREVTKTAGRTVSHIEAAIGGVSKMAQPLFLLELATKFMKRFKNSKRRK
jgi:uncharacterized protein YoxC